MAAEKVNYRGFKLYEDTTLSINLQAEQRPDMLERARERQEGIAFSSHQTRAACLRWLCWRWLPAQRRLIQCRDRSTRLLHARSWPIRPLRRRARLSSIRVVTFCMVQGGGQAIRYGVGVGREGFGWARSATIHTKQEWADWYPPAEMLQRNPTSENT